MGFWSAQVQLPGSTGPPVEVGRVQSDVKKIRRWTFSKVNIWYWYCARMMMHTVYLETGWMGYFYVLLRSFIWCTDGNFFAEFVTEDRVRQRRVVNHALQAKSWTNLPLCRSRTTCMRKWQNRLETSRLHVCLFIQSILTHYTIMFPSPKSWVDYG